MRLVKNVVLSSISLILLLAIAFSTGSGAVAQNDGPAGTISALQTQVAEFKGTSTSRGEKINEQRTQIADQKTQISALEGQIPPTMTATPVLSGKEAYTWLEIPAELDTRPFNHLGEKWVFCGTIATIFVAGPGQAFYPGETVSTGWNSIIQIRPDGYDNNFILGFDGDTTGMFEDSYVCAWATVVDTASFTNAFGGTISNTLFDAEFVELQ